MIYNTDHFCDVKYGRNLHTHKNIAKSSESDKIQIVSYLPTVAASFAFEANE